MAPFRCKKAAQRNCSERRSRVERSDVKMSALLLLSLSLTMCSCHLLELDDYAVITCLPMGTGSTSWYTVSIRESHSLHLNHTSVFSLMVSRSTAMASCDSLATASISETLSTRGVKRCGNLHFLNTRQCYYTYIRGTEKLGKIMHRFSNTTTPKRYLAVSIIHCTCVGRTIGEGHGNEMDLCIT